MKRHEPYVLLHVGTRCISAERLRSVLEIKDRRQSKFGVLTDMFDFVQVRVPSVMQAPGRAIAHADRLKAIDRLEEARRSKDADRPKWAD